MFITSDLLIQKAELKTKMVELSIIIVNWNGGDFLSRCIESIVVAPPDVPFDIIVVDNASTDDSVAWLQSREVTDLLGERDLYVIENSENVGFSRANNQAISLSNAPLLFLLNNDTEVKTGSIRKLISTLKSHERIGACGPRLLNTDGSVQASTFRNPSTAWEILVVGLRIYRLIPQPYRGELLLSYHWDHKRRRQVNMLSGAAILAKREMIDAVGGLDERFHMYGEDNEWCLRITRAGWKLIFEPDAVVVHHGSQGAMRRWNSLDKGLRMTEEWIRGQRYHLSKPHLISNILARLIIISIAHISRLLSRSSTVGTKAEIKLYIRSIKKEMR